MDPHAWKLDALLFKFNGGSLTTFGRFNGSTSLQNLRIKALGQSMPIICPRCACQVEIIGFERHEADTRTTYFCEACSQRWIWTEQRN